MLLEFKTKRDINGNSRYIAIDMLNFRYTQECPRMIIGDIPVLSVKDYKTVLFVLKENGFDYVDAISVNR